MSEARNRLIATQDHLRSLKLIIGALSLIVIAQWWRIGHLQDVRRIYIPPTMNTGLITSFEEVPSPVVYTFGLYIFQQLNRWASNGEKDYPKQIYRLQGFLSPSCIDAFEADMNEKRRRGELRQRARMVQEISGHGFSRKRVQADTDDRWRLWLDLNVQETIANHEVKNVNLRYELNVVRFDVDREINPWGLALSCEGKPAPVLLTEDDLERTF